MRTSETQEKRGKRREEKKEGRKKDKKWKDKRRQKEKIIKMVGGIEEVTHL